MALAKNWLSRPRGSLQPGEFPAQLATPAARVQVNTNPFWAAFIYCRAPWALCSLLRHRAGLLPTTCAHWGRPPRGSTTAPQSVNSCWNKVWFWGLEQPTQPAHLKTLCRTEKKSWEDGLTQSSNFFSLRCSSIFVGDNNKATTFLYKAEAVGLQV